MERVIINHRIQTYLSRLDDQLIFANRNGEGNLAKACESLVRELFSLIYGKKFVNANLGISNFPAIDLHDIEGRVALQVTSNRGSDKVLDCFDKFFKHGLHKRYDELFIVVLGNKYYNVPKLAKRYSDIESKHGVEFPFEISRSIVDLSVIYNKITQELSAEKVIEVLGVLIRYFEKFKSIVSLESYYEELRLKFFEVIMDDPRGLTLNSIYVDPEFWIHKASANKVSKEIKEFYEGFVPSKEISIHQLLSSRFSDEKIYDERKFEGRRNHILELIDQPLLLYIVASLNNEIAIDSNRSEIYNKLFDQIIERRYSRDGQIENLKTLSKDDLRAMLQEIAFLIFISGRGYVTTAEILKNEEMLPYLEKIGDNHLSGTLKGILISFYFKERAEDVHKNEPAGIEFFHKSLQEYLTAEKLVNMVFKRILNKDQHGDYILTKNEDFLTLINDVFGRIGISREIRSFIKELILKQPPQARFELAQRLSKPLEYLFEKDFLLELRKDDFEPFDRAMYTFMSYWHFLHSLEAARNYLTSESLSIKFNAYFSFIQLSEKNQVDEKWVNHQELKKVDINSWFQIEDELIGTTFANCTIEDMALYECEVSGSTFDNCDIHSLNFDECNITGLDFRKCYLHEFKSIDSKVSSITFNECELRGEIKLSKTSKKNVIFYNSIFYEKAYLSLSEIMGKVKFVGCSLRKVVKVKGRFVSRDVDAPIANN